MMTKTGTFTPETDYFYGYTMMNGSTIDLSARSGPWFLQSAAVCGRQIVDFADDATIYVKPMLPLSRRVPVISWNDSARPANLDSLTFKRGDIGRGVKFLKRDDGLYALTGTVIIVQ